MTNAETFADQLRIGNREFFLLMNEILESDGLIIQYSDNRVTYFPDTNRKEPRVLKKQQPLVLRYTIEAGALTVELKLNFIDCYTDMIEQMPEHVKSMFRSIWHCGQNPYCDRPWVDGVPVWIDGSPNCGIRRTYTIDGVHYHLCSYKYYFTPDISNPDDVEYYAAIIKAEVSAAKTRKKHNVAYYNQQGQTIIQEKSEKEPLTEDTIIGSRKISAVEFRRFFKKTLGEDYEKHPIVHSVIKVSFYHKGKSLREIIEECGK